ncbi:hypothetical protein AB0F81_51090, partial [Actinoplanes sp. NPDC024001]
DGPRRAARRVAEAADEALPTVTDRSRQAVRRVMDVAADAATEAAANLTSPDPWAPRSRKPAGEDEQAAAEAAAAAVRAAAESLAPEGEKEEEETPPRPDATEP